MRNADTVLGKNLQEKLKHLWEDHIKIDLEEMVYVIVDWMHLDQLGTVVIQET
jgi:hypothetical protein